MDTCIFCKIASHEIPKEFDYEDDDVMAFADIHPVTKVHVLIVPKKHIPDFMDVNEKEIFDKLKEVAQKIVTEKELEGKGYRLVINAGGAQVVNHLHLHLMGPLGKSVQM
ncbi:MAG: HIT domain-containing protein [Patescibacteria group bacterium]